MEPNLAASLSNFAFRFCNEQPNDKTFICSPLSAEMVLALTALGSAGDTHAELLRTMGLPDDEALRSLFGYLTSSLKSIEGVTLRIANRVYVTNKDVLKPSIKKDAEEVFDSGLEQLDFTQREAAADIMNKWEQPNDKTFICSPLSAEMVLALTALGSAGDTHAELLRTMGLPDDEALRSLFGYLTSSLKSIEGVTLRIANRVYVTNKDVLKPSIKKDAEEVFDSGLEQLDFTQREAAADIMNKWVAEQTDNMIKKVLTSSSLNETGLVLVNAIYFQGFWENPFKKRATREWPFHVNSTTEIKVAMMSKRSENFRYKHSPELKAKILRMFYKGGKTSMVFVLPDEIEGLNEVLQQLASGHDLMADIADLQSTLCNVMIPKFKVETDINLNELLPKMGIKQIFNELKSDIRMLANQRERMFVSKAVQKAVIEVDEAGTKAAVRTCVEAEIRFCGRSVQKIESFIANRPFLYLLMAQDIPLFLGALRCGKFITPITREPMTRRSHILIPPTTDQAAVLAQTDVTSVNDQKAVNRIYNGHSLIESNEIPTPVTTGVEEETANRVLPDQ